jgi:arylsulfatase
MFFHTYEIHYPYTRNYFIRKEGSNFATNQEKVIARYDSGIWYADDAIRKLIEVLIENGIYNNTLIILTSDHGETFRFMEPDAPSGDHGISLYDDEIKIPLIIGGATKFRTSRRITSQVRSIDIMPTILDYLEINIPDDIRGASLLPLLSGEDHRERIAFSESTWKAPCESKALRTNNFKYIQNFIDGQEPSHGKFKNEIYNLKKDPGETDQEFSQYKYELNRYKLLMKELLNQIQIRIKKLVLLMGSKQNENRDLVKQLTGLGYLN